MNKISFGSLCLILLFATADVLAEDRLSRATAETLLLYQRDNGGWPKNFEWDDRVDDHKKKELLSQKRRNDTTIDNSATHNEIRYLAQAYVRLKDERRTGYSWLGYYGDSLLKREYPAWQKKWAGSRDSLPVH